MNINEIETIVEHGGIVFLSYEGFLSQTLISGMAEVLEKEAESSDLSMNDSTNIFTIFIELTQNLMKYSQAKRNKAKEIVPDGIIVVVKNIDSYEVHSKNSISIEDKVRIEKSLMPIMSMTRDEIKARYKELRRSGKESHDKGGGIGFYEIAKRCDKVEYEIKPRVDGAYDFHLKATLHVHKG